MPSKHLNPPIKEPNQNPTVFGLMSVWPFGSLLRGYRVKDAKPVGYRIDTVASVQPASPS